MAETKLTPYLMELIKDTGVMCRGVEKAVGGRMKLPANIHTAIDKIDAPIYADIKMALLCVVAGAYVDKHWPDMLKEKGAEERGEIVHKLGCELYRLLTDGLSIDVIRHVSGYPDPQSEGMKS